MDEPFSALDPLIRREMQEQSPAPAREGKDHGLHHARPDRGDPLGDRIAVMRDGASCRSARPKTSSAAGRRLRREFVRDIPRSHVLTLRCMMRDAHDGRGERPAPRRAHDRAERDPRDRRKREKPVCATDERAG